MAAYQQQAAAMAQYQQQVQAFAQQQGWTPQQLAAWQAQQAALRQQQAAAGQQTGQQQATAAQQAAVAQQQAVAAAQQQAVVAAQQQAATAIGQQSTSATQAAAQQVVATTQPAATSDSAATVTADATAQAQPQAGQQGQATAATATPAEEAAAECIGNEQRIMITGCTHQTVGQIVRGTFTLLADENHSKPAYKKDTQVNGLDVMLYYWDDRDGPNFCGWWFGPKIGGDQVWAYHPGKQTSTPPKTGWKVPYDGPVDPTFVISKAMPGMAAAGQAQQVAQAQVAAQQQVALQQQIQAWVAQMQQQGMNPQQAQLMAQQMAAKQQEMMKQEQLKKIEQMRQHQQVAMQRQHLDQNRRKLEESNQSRIAEQQRRLLEIKKQQEDMVQKQQEQVAAIQIRRVLMKFAKPTLDTFDALHQELQEICEAQLPACGSAQDRVKDEVDRGIAQAQAKLDQIREARRLEEDKKAEFERKRQEAVESAKKLLLEFQEMVEIAEASSERLLERAKALSEEGPNQMSLAEIDEAADALEEASKEAKDNLKACQEILSVKGPHMRVNDPKTPQNVDDPNSITKLAGRISEASKTNDKTIAGARQSKEKVRKSAEARAKMNSLMAVFANYDVDNDGCLNDKEVQKYAKGEFGFQVPEQTMETIWKVVVIKGDKGVRKDNLQRLKAIIGIAREREIDQARREERLEKEKKIATLKAALMEKVDEVGSQVQDASDKLDKIEQESPLSNKAKAMSATDMVVEADRLDELVQEAKEAKEVAKKSVAELGEGVASDLNAWINGEEKKLEMKMARFDFRLSKAQSNAQKFREEAKRKETEELVKLERRALVLLRYHQRINKLSTEDLFKFIDSNGDGKIGEEDFVAFFAKCDKEQKKKPAAVDQAKDGENAEDDSSDIPAEEDLRKIFQYVDEEETGELDMNTFCNFVRYFMKVSKDTVLTGDLAIKDSKTVRRMEVGEVVEILAGPMDEGNVKVQRVRCRAMKDSLEGWITCTGNQGSTFLDDGGNLFKVVTETILTESFELDGAPKETKKRTFIPNRKLKVGEIVEVREWARPEEKSGLMRMKCRVMADGVTGWVTTVGNQGKVFLQVA